MNNSHINDVTLKGMIVHISSFGKLTLVTLSVRNYARKPEQGQKFATDTPIISFFDAQAKEVAENFKRYDHVTIKAIVQNTYNRSQLTGRQECWGISIEKTPTVIGSETGDEAGHIYPDDVNKVVLKGKLVSAWATAPNWIKISLRTVGDNYKSTNIVSYRVENSKTYVSNLTKGSLIAMSGRISVINRKGKDVPEDRTKQVGKSKSTRYEEVIANELAVLIKAPAQTDENTAVAAESEQSKAADLFD